MLNINVDGLNIPERFIDNWRIIVQLTADLLQLGSATVFVCRNDEADVLCSHVNEVAFSGGTPELMPFVRHVVKSRQPLRIPEFDTMIISDTGGENNPGIVVGLPLCWPTGQLFGVLLVADEHERVFTVNESLLLENYQQTIEFHLKSIYQQAEIHTLTQYIDQPKAATVDYKNLTDSLSKEIDRRKVVERQLRYHKHYDSGTGFLNRLSLDMKLQNLLSDSNCEFGLIYIGFKNAYRLQSQYGYQAWDDVLKQYRSRLNHIGDHVRILTTRPNSTDLVLIIESGSLMSDLAQICRILSGQNPDVFNVQHQSVYLHSYIGVSVSSEAQTATDLLELALTAMLSCKDSGHTCTYSYELQAKSQLHLHQLENFLFHAVKNENLLLYFQPKVCLQTRQWLGAEALLRWQHPVLGDISNETLIHLAEKNGLIFDIGNFVLRTAIQKARQWRCYSPDFKMAVNVSALQLCDVRFVDQIQLLLREYHLPPRFLEIEVTESELITDEAVATDVLQRLHELGITLALDDFGTGYASFSYLKKYPFDCIKIDKSFIHSVDYSEKDREITCSIIQIARKLELQVIIEGIETQAQEEFALSEGCSSVQGFFYARPMPSHEFEKKLIGQQLPSYHDHEVLP